jgi:uncharacterized protein (TIGR02246 family)
MSAPRPHHTIEDHRAEVRHTLQRISTAWRDRRYQELAILFDENIVMVLPGLSARIEGRAAVVDSYMEFMEHSAVGDYWEDEPTIDVWGDTAIASYRWEMMWVSGGISESAAGYDVFTFSRRTDGDQAWRAVWRTMALDVVPEDHSPHD